MEIILMRKPPMSEHMWAASVKMAKELDMTPPTISEIMKKMHIINTHLNFLKALSPFLSLAWKAVSSDSKQTWFCPFSRSSRRSSQQLSSRSEFDFTLARSCSPAWSCPHPWAWECGIRFWGLPVPSAPYFSNNPLVFYSASPFLLCSP